MRMRGLFIPRVTRMRKQRTLTIYTSVSGCGCDFGFEQKYWRIDGFGEKKARIGGFAYPYSPPPYRILRNETKQMNIASIRDNSQIPLCDNYNLTRHWQGMKQRKFRICKFEICSDTSLLKAATDVTILSFLYLTN